ncbi:MAG: hypothetical protein P9M06_04005 [Candidatus Saelkia tenebricola]|nr:hypothetical protein [Candidatus Saelkia tenebricola]
MSEKRQKILILISLVIIMVIVFSYRFLYRSIDKHQYQKITSGMNIDEIKYVLGEPVKISKYFCQHHGASEVWRYNIKHSLLVVTVWFQPTAEGEMCVYNKAWGFLTLSS